MATILKFGKPEKIGNNNIAEAQPCDIQCGDDGGKTVIDCHNPQTVEASLPIGWSNQELADLHRVVELLRQAGIFVETEQGISDENDPWFVFCQSDGEVFIHLCRIDGQYWLDSPNVAEPVVGYDFRSLIDNFVGRTRELEDRQNIVKFRPKSGLYSHPAVMLAALVWSIYLTSDELTDLANGRSAQDYVSTDAPGKADISHSDAVKALTKAFETANVEDDADIAAMAARNTQSTSMSSLASAQSIAVGLSILAITYGFIDQVSFEGLKEAAALIGAEADAKVIDVVAEDVTADGETIIKTSGDGAERVAGHFDQADSKANGAQLVTDDLGAELATIDLAVQSSSLDGPLDGNVDEVPVHIASDSDFDLDLTLVTNKVSSSYGDQTETEQDNVAATVTLSVFDNIDLSQAIANTALYTYNVGDVEVVSSIELNDDFSATLTEQNISEHSSLNPNSVLLKPGIGVDLQVEIVADVQVDKGADVQVDTAIQAPETASPSTRFAEYSDEVKVFIDYILSKTSAIEIIATANEIVLLDTSAFDDVSDVAYAQSWEMGGEGIISTVGHLHDFESFGLA